MIRMLSRSCGATLGLAVLVMALIAAPAQAQVAQTITIDGVNDFNAANLFSDDSDDTEIKDWCTDDPGDDFPMDIRQVFVTNDVNNLYIGFEYDRDCFGDGFPQINLGMAFSYGAAADGGSTDPFNRKIAWNDVVEKPDNVVYAVIDGFNYEVLYQWNGANWGVVQDGSDGLGMANDTGFEEIAIPLSSFTNGQAGLNPGDTVKIELWMTQDGTTKPALDAVASDAAQQSTPAGTTFDVTGDPIEMTGYIDYTIINAVDNDPPLVTAVSLIDGDTTQLRVTFNEPVDPTTAGNPANFSADLQSGGSAGFSAATVSGSHVDLTASSPIDGATALWTLTLSGVEDLAGNTSNAGYDFAVKNITFQGLFGPFLETNATGPSDFFTVEGSRTPLDFGPAQGDDEMVLVDVENDIYELTTPFSWYVGPNGGAKATTDIVVEWKFAFNLSYENGNNQILPISESDDATTVVSRYWEDLDPSQFTTVDIDVIFSLDTAGLGVQGGDTIEIAGNVAPLSFDSPYLALVDDGSGQDASAGDGIYTPAVTFPAGSLKNLNYKFVFNTDFECFGQGDRTLFLNDEVFGTIGSPAGPLTLPVATFDRCSALAGPADVVFSVDITGSTFDVTPPLPTVELTGNVAPLSFESGVQMFDDGVAPDDVAGDKIYSLSVSFPDSSNRFLEYKYLVGGQFEAQGAGNRSVVLDDANGSPQVLPTDAVNFVVPTGVGDTPVRGARIAVKAVPNPFNPQTSIVFEMPSRGDVQVEIFDVRGRSVRSLHRGVLDAGEHAQIWDGRADDGRPVASGVYFARVQTKGLAAAARLVLVK